MHGLEVTQVLQTEILLYNISYIALEPLETE
jgi:hypothetical protein